MLVLASRYDARARALVERWSGSGARLLTCEDLSVAGWRYAPGDIGSFAGVIGGRAISVDEISGVLTLLPYVAERELVRIAREERRYVASEMTAFLRAWLSALPCPVLNRPVPTSLSGPDWCQEQWVLAASRLGTRVRPVRRHIAYPDGAAEAEPAHPDVTVTVVGERCPGAEDGAIAARARRLARAAGVDLLTVRFAETGDGPELLDATPWPDTSSPEVAQAIFEYLSSP